MARPHASRPAGAVLKKRFDDIFDSARYTKALDVLNKQKKGLASKAKDISGDLKGLHADKVAAQDHLKRKASAEKAIETADAQIKACDDKQSALRDEKARISDKMRKLQAQEQGLQECRAEVDGLERSLKYLEERLADSALMDEDDEVLAATVLIAASGGLPAALRHRCDSFPSHEAVGGLFFEFERVSGESATRYISHTGGAPPGRGGLPVRDHS